MKKYIIFAESDDNKTVSRFNADNDYAARWYCTGILSAISGFLIVEGSKESSFNFRLERDCEKSKKKKSLIGNCVVTRKGLVLDLQWVNLKPSLIEIELSIERTEN